MSREGEHDDDESTLEKQSTTWSEASIPTDVIYHLYTPTKPYCSSYRMINVYPNEHWPSKGAVDFRAPGLLYPRNLDPDLTSRPDNLWDQEACPLLSYVFYPNYPGEKDIAVLGHYFFKSWRETVVRNTSRNYGCQWGYMDGDRSMMEKIQRLPFLFQRAKDENGLIRSTPRRRPWLSLCGTNYHGLPHFEIIDTPRTMEWIDTAYGERHWKLERRQMGCVSVGHNLCCYTMAGGKLCELNVNETLLKTDELVSEGHPMSAHESMKGVCIGIFQVFPPVLEDEYRSEASIGPGMAEAMVQMLFHGLALMQKIRLRNG